MFVTVALIFNPLRSSETYTAYSLNYSYECSHNSGRNRFHNFNLIRKNHAQVLSCNGHNSIILGVKIS
jgi:hypothetical protein